MSRGNNGYVELKYVEMKKILVELNKKWKLDFVSATAGDCCNNCGKMMTQKATNDWIAAKTYLVVKWFFKGMNHYERFEDQNGFFLKYNLGELAISDVCTDLQVVLGSRFKVVVPESNSTCIEVKVVEEEI